MTTPYISTEQPVGVLAPILSCGLVTCGRLASGLTIFSHSTRRITNPPQVTNLPHMIRAGGSRSRSLRWLASRVPGTCDRNPACISARADERRPGAFLALLHRYTARCGGWAHRVRSWLPRALPTRVLLL